MVTETGYRRRTYEEILNAKIEKAKELFGYDINTEGNTALGKYIRINAYDQYNVESTAEKIYYSIFPQTASGQSLDRLAWTIGLTRNAAKYSVYSVRIAGTAGETIKFGFPVGTDSGLAFHNCRNTVIGADGYCDLIVECDESGEIGNVAAEDIVKIIEPVSYVREIIAAENAIISEGSDEESDYDFLKRYELAREGKGSCNEAAILSALLSVPSVEDAYIKVTESNPVGDIPAHTIACYVRGGESSQRSIAEAIFEKKPLAVGTYGTESVSISYGALQDYIVKFSYAETKEISISVSLVTNNTFASGAEANIKENIDNHIKNMGIGQPLILTALYPAIYSVNGVVSAQITASVDGGEYGAADIVIEPHEIIEMQKLLINGNEI